MSEPSSKFRSTVKALALMTTMSSYLVGSILVGVFTGRWADNRFDGDGLFIGLGVLLGIGTAITGIYFAIRKFLGEESS
ncbi:AtpZ/AtpI family protein [Evansella cellulosilytica]|uniref:AtpZ/AtpI family protein n=1 Tax=Evansella cellulosilytica (strain ATCC 21833 / DSM 2522 / FERM P-1141 / JCM 9156 / N-4) TaxID=649639 RepID=E6TXB1_EVAC2|nr:AtpZ/AtpI family protein [Evansella cellulosilytica]ADU32306.1 hypothetical protein Bcell_4076 [Evansella cellulosilytica DSM 2522]